MSDANSKEMNRAKVAPLRRISPLWLIPVVTLAVGAVMVYDNWSKRGPLITLEFATAEGLEAGITKIKTREVEVGEVEEIHLKPDLNGVIVTARMHYEVKKLLAKDSRFWLVQPTVSLSGVSGLGTLLTGQYIRFSPGSSSEMAERFTGLDAPPLTPLNTPGLRITLTTDGDFSFSKGDQIHYRGITVGTVESVDLNFAENKIYYSAFIRAPYHQLITAETRFWKASGIRAELTSQGLAVDTGTLDTLILGGISFTTPDGHMAAETAPEQSLFFVYPNRNAIKEKQYLYSIRYWVMVNDNVGGLNAGAAVMHRGVQVGKVVRTDYVPEGGNLLDKNMDIPIMIEINPGRLGMPDSEESLLRATTDINTWISQGLTATIKTQNILLGQRMVDLNYDGPGIIGEPEYMMDLAIIPTGVDSIDKFTQSIEAFITKVNRLPLEAITEKLQTLLDDGSEAVTSFRDLAQSGQALVDDGRNAELIEQLTATLSSMDALAHSFSSESQTNEELVSVLQSMAALFEELKPLIDDLKQKPNSLVFPYKQEEEAVPMRKQR